MAAMGVSIFGQVKDLQTVTVFRSVLLGFYYIYVILTFLSLRSYCHVRLTRSGLLAAVGFQEKSSSDWLSSLSHRSLRAAKQTFRLY